MRLPGKILLFLSSYFVLFIILALIEASKLHLEYILNFNPGWYSDNIYIKLLIVFYLFLALLSIYSIISFKSTYEKGSITRNEIIVVSSISNVTSDVLSYLVTYIIPITTQFSIPMPISNSWLNWVIMLILLGTMLIIYIKSNLLVVNPTLVVFGHTLYKIEYDNKYRSMKIEGVLLAKNKFNMNEVKGVINVNKIDENIYYLI